MAPLDPPSGSKPVIVTGGAGFIGSQLVAALNRRGIDNIVVVDNLGRSGKWKNLVGLRMEDYRDKADFIKDVEAGRLAAPRTVFHLGACSSTTEADASYLAENNYRYSRRLCQWALAHGARFIVASSAATYGDGSEGYSDDDSAAPKLRPLNMYGHSKQMFDLWAYREGVYGKIAGLKFFNVYGPGEDHKEDMRSVVHKAHRQILDTGELQLFKSHRPEYRDGEQLRDFVYVKDAVDVMLFFMDWRDRSGLFNCGTGQARTWLDLARAIFAAMGREPNIRFIDMPPGLQEKYQYYTQADPAKLRAAGYDAPFRTIEQGVREYIEYLNRKNAC